MRPPRTTPRPSTLARPAARPRPARAAAAPNTSPTLSPSVLVVDATNVAAGAASIAARWRGGGDGGRRRGPATLDGATRSALAWLAAAAGWPPVRVALFDAPKGGGAPPLPPGLAAAAVAAGFVPLAPAAGTVDADAAAAALLVALARGGVARTAVALASGDGDWRAAAAAGRVGFYELPPRWAVAPRPPPALAWPARTAGRAPVVPPAGVLPPAAVEGVVRAATAAAGRTAPRLTSPSPSPPPSRASVWRCPPARARLHALRGVLPRVAGAAAVAGWPAVAAVAAVDGDAVDLVVAPSPSPSSSPRVSVFVGLPGDYDAPSSRRGAAEAAARRVRGRGARAVAVPWWEVDGGDADLAAFMRRALAEGEG